MAFLNPIGQDEPEANSLCTWLSVVLAPIAPHEIKSAIYCGVITSKNSVPAGMPKSFMFLNNCLDTDNPLSISKELSRSGSFMRPFQPIVVLGFSKYTLMIIKSSSFKLFFSSSNRFAYSIAASVSCMEQGPTTTASLLSFLLSISENSLLAEKTVSEDISDMGCSDNRELAEITSCLPDILKSLVFCMVKI